MTNHLLRSVETRQSCNKTANSAAVSSHSSFHYVLNLGRERGKKQARKSLPAVCCCCCRLHHTSICPSCFLARLIFLLLLLQDIVVEVVSFFFFFFPGSSFPPAQVNIVHLESVTGVLSGLSVSNSRTLSHLTNWQLIVIVIVRCGGDGQEAGEEKRRSRWYFDRGSFNFIWAVAKAAANCLTNREFHFTNVTITFLGREIRFSRRTSLPGF